MDDIEERVHNLICDYITKRIRSSLRVTSEMKGVTFIRIEKEVKVVLDEALKIIPDTLSVVERSE
jgi:hypothetical protein